MANARQVILEAPIDFGEAPDFIPPGKKTKMRKGHPYEKSDAFPKESDKPGQSYAERLASDTYPEIVKKVARATGITPRTHRDIGPLMGQMMDALGRIQQIERGHEQELEQAAVEVVLSLPEYRSLAKAVQKGELIVKGELTAHVDLKGAQMDAEEAGEEAEEEIAQVAQELDIEVEKRRFINMLIHGAAETKHSAYLLASDKINAIDPQLLNLYGILNSVGQFSYWIMPEEIQRQMAGGGGGGEPSGAAKISQNDDGVPVIHAQANNFALLIYELSKAIMEYLSYPDEDDPETAKTARDRSDLLGEEPWAIMLGHGAWKRVLAAIGPDAQEYMPDIYDHLMRLPTGEFNKIANGILRGSTEAKRFLADLVAQFKAEDENQVEESKEGGQSVAARLLEDESSGNL